MISIEVTSTLEAICLDQLAWEVNVKEKENVRQMEINVESEWQAGQRTIVSINNIGHTMGACCV